MKLTDRFRLSRQMREVLLFLSENSEHVHPQVSIIRGLYGEENAHKSTRKASLCRTMRTLMDEGLVERYSAIDLIRVNFESRKSVDLRSQYFCLTENGEGFVKDRILPKVKDTT